MPHADFVHLRVHSAYSLSEGAIKAEKIAALARDAAMPAVAITDTNNLFGALEFSQACAAKGVQPIIGCQLAITRSGEMGARLPPDPVVLLAQDGQGLVNLQRLSSAAYLESDPAHQPQVRSDRLRAQTDGLLLLTGGHCGPVARAIAEGQQQTAQHVLAELAEAFSDRIAVELHRHGTASELSVEAGLVLLADEAGLPLVATNNCFFATPAMQEAHDALLCIAESRLVAERDRRRVTSEHWFKPAVAMRAAFGDLPEACDNTLAIARRCAVMAETRKPMLPISPKVLPGSTEPETLARMARIGLAARLNAQAGDAADQMRYKERLEYELSVIAAMGFPGYFLIVADFIQWAKGQGIPVGPGRGSGAGSVVAWALTITDLDPLRWGLLFERFLNPERVSMPDFDIDFCQDRRDEVIEYVRREYGADRVAQIITFGKLQARAAVRDVGRVLGLPFGQVNKVAELIPNNPAKPTTLEQAIEGEPRLRQMRDADESVRRMMEVALQLEGLYRHTSTHAAGVVIGDRPLLDVVPLYRDPRSDMLVTQYSMKHVEQAGLVKFDFLGLTTLTILQRGVRYLASSDIMIDLDRLPLDDGPTYAMLQRGDAGGVFQFESIGMRDVLRQMRPDRFEDLIAAVALYRPGPMANIPEFCRRKHEGAEAAPHPLIETILAETYGIIVYQEQVMQIAQVMAGYSLGAADSLRRAMGKKIRAEMETHRATFIGGAIDKGIASGKAAEVFDLMAKFADYGFNKSHAAAYALVAYQTAWMKANHPVAFMAACMSLAISNTDRLASLKQDAERAGIRLLPPDINRSEADFALEPQPDGTVAIRYALAAVKKVGVAAMQEIVRNRGSCMFRDLADFAARAGSADLNKMQIENLARAGAFDGLEPNRARVLGGAETILRRAQADAVERSSGQTGLFGARDAEIVRLPPIPEWPAIERLGFEAEAIGFHLTAHPLDTYTRSLRRLGVTPIARLEGRREQGRVRLAGIVLGEKQRTTRTGSRMAWVRVSDATGSIEITVFSEVLGRSRDLLAEGQAVLVTAVVKSEGDALRITAQDFVSLERATSDLGVGMRVWLACPEAVDHIRALLDREGQGKGQVILVPRLGDGASVEMHLPGAFRLSPGLTQALEASRGVNRVEEL